MKVGIDCYALRFQPTGIVNYNYHLVSELMTQFPNEQYKLLVENENFSAEEIQTLAKRGSFVHVASDFPDPTNLPQRLANAVKRRLIHYSHPQTGRFRRMLPRLQHNLAQATAGLDVYHAIDWFFYPASRARNVITLFDLTTTLFGRYHDKTAIHKERLKRSLLKEYDSIIAISESTKQDAIELYGLESNQVKVIFPAAHSSFDDASYKNHVDICKRYKIPVNEPFFLSVSTIEPRKNFKQVLIAFEKFCNRSTIRTNLVCTGVWGWKNEELKRHIANMRYKDRVIFTGYIPLEDLPSLYHYATVFIYISFYEGFGLPILEAMKCETPVICSNTSSMPEVVGEDGHLVDPNDAEQVTVAMESLISDESKRNALASRALQRSKLFSWQTAARQTMRVYQGDEPNGTPTVQDDTSF